MRACVCVCALNNLHIHIKYRGKCARTDLNTKEIKLQNIRKCKLFDTWLLSGIQR